MLEIIMWSLLAFFSVFGIIEFVRFVYTDWKCRGDEYHVVINANNLGDDVEASVRNTLLAVDSASVIILDDNSSAERSEILRKLISAYSYIRIMDTEEYVNFLYGREC